jgi:hypothetical protein
MIKKPEISDDKPAPSTTPPAAPKEKAKKKLSLDISDVSEVLERKISP